MKTISRPEILLCIQHLRNVSMMAPESVEGITDPGLGAIPDQDHIPVFLSKK